MRHDPENLSPHGRAMAWRKFLTRWTPIEFVPRYYCNARYPPLARIGARIAAAGGHELHLQVADDGKKRALLLQRPR